MCGLVGILAKESRGFFTKDADIFQQMVYADAVRGWDATGVFGVNKYGNVDILKQAVAAGPFLVSNQYEEFRKDLIAKYHIVIGHNRKATHGEKRDIDAHPFWSKNEDIVLVHNGMISNHKKFCDVSTVDSAAIAEALSTKDKEDVLKDIEGAFAFIWYNVNEKKLYFIRNSARPLNICETSDAYILASEPEMAHWIINRNNTKMLSFTQVKEHVLYCYDLESRKIMEVKEIEKKKVIQTYYTTPPTTKTNTTPPTTTKNDFKICPDTYFYSNEDFKTVDDVIHKIKRNDSVCITVDSYEEISNYGNNRKSYKLLCSLINVQHRWINVTLYTSMTLFDSLDITKVLEVDVLSLNQSGHTIEIFVNKPEEQNYETTENNMMITENMWMDDKVPIECDTCSDILQWNRVADTAIYIEGGMVIGAYCPKCLGLDHDKTSSASPI